MTAVEIILVIVAATLAVVTYTQHLTQQAITDLDRRIREGSPAVDRELVELNARVRRLENLSELLAPSGRKQ